MFKVEEVILESIIKDIEGGVYKDNEKLPSDKYFCDKYNVPRMRIREIYKRLEAMGYTYSYQGRGRYVKGRITEIKLVLSGDESFTRKIKEQGHNLETTNLCCVRIPFNERVYKELKASKDDEVYKVSRVRKIDKECIAVHNSYVLRRIFPLIYEEGKFITSMFEFYKGKGFNEFESKKSLLSISYPTLEEREMLNCRELSPILKLETNCIDKLNEEILEYTEIVYRGDKFKYEL